MFGGYFKKALQEPVDTREKEEAFAVMNRQIDEHGGSLTFSIAIEDDGWSAQCKQFPAIITGGEDPNPTQKEIILAVIDAVKTAFGVPICELEETLIPTESCEPLSVSHSQPKILLEQVVNLA